MFETLYTPTAIKELRRLPTNIARRIMERIERIAADPHAADNNVSMLNSPLTKLALDTSGLV